MVVRTADRDLHADVDQCKERQDVDALEREDLPEVAVVACVWFTGGLTDESKALCIK